MNHEDYLKKAKQLNKLCNKVNPPYGHLKLRGWDGGLIVSDEFGHLQEYTPKEAVRIAKWILLHYGENPEEVYLG